MAYAERQSPDLIDDLYARKEFAQLWMPPRDPNVREFELDEFSQSHQQFARTFLNPSTPYRRLHLMHSTGCHAPGTQIRMFDGSTRAVENIKIGDILARHDGKQARVMRLHRGVDDMYCILPAGLSPTYVNGGHIMHVTTHPDRVNELDAFVDIPLNELVHDNSTYYIAVVDGDYLRAARFVVTSTRRDHYYGFRVFNDDGLYLDAQGIVHHNSGKTRAAIGVAQEFIKMYRVIYRGANWRDPTVNTPSVFVIAFGGKRAFVRDLIKYPEYGYASAAEYETLVKLQMESAMSQSAYQKFSDMYSLLKRRTTNRARGGFYRMYGYDEFANRLFGRDSALIPGIVDRATSNREPPIRALERAIASGEIHVDQRLISQMENSLIIADEIHNTYNTVSINTRGLAILYIIDHVPSVRFISLSATPINGSPGEIADFINYFTPPDVKYARTDLFTGNDATPEAHSIITEKMHGSVSYMFDYDPRYFPRRIDVGQPAIINGEELPYSRFTLCEMSPFHRAAIVAFYADNRGNVDDAGEPEEYTADADDSVVGIPPRAYSLFDFVFPNPIDNNIGLYDSSTLFTTLHTAPERWKRETGVHTYTVGSIRIIGGTFLREQNITRYSAKYARLLSVIRDDIKRGGASKMIIYHERVRTTGVLLIREILRENGFIEESEEPNDSTICAICAVGRREHGDSHEYRPARFVTMYSELDKSVITSIREKFNSSSNLHGEWCSILIGSRLIRESYDFYGVRFMYILSLPSSIPQLIQVFGRCIRRGSHLQLPPNERDVSINIIANAADVSGNGSIIGNATESPEMRRYAIKLRTYLVIQDIEREMARAAIDSGLNANIITRPERDEYGALKFDSSVKFTPGGDLRLDTFFAYGYGQQEIKICIELIKQLMRIRTIQTARELINSIRTPPFRLPFNAGVISDSSIVIAISYLLPRERISMQDARIMYIGNIPHVLTVSCESHDSPSSHVIAGISEDSVFTLSPVGSVTIAGITQYKPIIDLESSIREGGRSSADITLDVSQIKTISRVDESILAILRERYAGRGARGARLIETMRGFLTEFSTDQQRAIARNFIDDTDFASEFGALFTFLNNLGIFVHYGYVMKYRDVARRLTFPESTAADRVIGFGDGAAIQLYTGAEWISINRAALNLHVESEENKDIIGVYRQFPYSVKFQIRKPIQKIRGSARDARLIERGMVCATRARRDIIADARLLGISGKDIEKSGTAADICELIERELLLREINEYRSHGRNAIKYIQGWWSVIPVFF